MRAGQLVRCWMTMAGKEEGCSPLIMLKGSIMFQTLKWKIQGNRRKNGKMKLHQLLFPVSVCPILPQHFQESSFPNRKLTKVKGMRINQTQ